MIVTLSTDKLKEILDLTSRFVSRHSTLPILENVYIKGNIDTLLFKATDMEKYIELEIPANIESEGAITVNAKMFLEIVKMIDDEQIKLIVDEDNDVITIKTSSDEFKLKWIPASEYVASPSIEDGKQFRISSEIFLKWIEKVEYAVTEKNFAPVLTGILIRLKKEENGNKLIFVWTDSFRLAEYKVDYVDELNEEKIDTIIPKVNIWEITRVVKFGLDKWLESIDVIISENLVWFKIEVEDYKIFVSSIVIQWDFPNYENESVIPTQFNTKVTVDAEVLEKAIKKVLTFTKAENNFVEIIFQTDGAVVSSWLTDIGEGKTKIPAVVDWQEISIGINGKYILEFLKVVEGQQININIVDSERPVVFKDILDDKYTYVVRPLIK